MNIYLKEANLEDAKEEYKAIKQIPEMENGFENKYFDVTYEEFVGKVLPETFNHSKGIGLQEGYVPDTYYFLWADDKIVGLFKIRHYLNEFLAKGPGHIGCTILSEYRGKGYGTKGLELAINICKKLIKEDEIYLSVYKDNLASLQIQKKNGAYIVGETEKEYLTRIRLNRDEK